MAKTTDAATAPTPAVTTPVEPVAPPAEPAQNNDAIVQELNELKGKLSEYQTLQEGLKKERNDAVAERLRQEAMYKGLQNQTTRTLQRAAEDRKVFEQANKDRVEIAEIKATLEVLANRVLDEDEQKELKFAQRELKLKLAEQAQAVAVNAPAVEPTSTAASYQQEAAPEFNKAQFVDYYFPGVEVDPNDPRIDWATDVQNTQEAFRRFTMSMLQIKDEIDQTRTQDVVGQLKAQSEEALKALETQSQELASQNAAEIERVKAESLDTARKEGEKRLRKLGADVEGTPAADGTHRTLAQQINEGLDDNLLTQGKKGQDEYARRVDQVKKQVRDQFQQR